MNSLTLRIEKKGDIFSNKEQNIVNFLLDPEITSKDLNIKNILEKTKTGYSTFYNFLKKIDFDNIKDLLLAFKEGEIERQNVNKDFDNDIKEFQDINNAYLKIIKDNSDNLSLDVIDELISYLINKKNIYFVGLGESNIMCEEISMRLIRIGINSYVINYETGLLISKCMSLKEDDLLICVSVSGESRTIVKAAEIGIERGSTVYAITSNLNSSLSKICKKIVPIYFSIKKTDLEFYISTLLPAIYFFDLLARRILTLYGDKYQIFRNKTSQIITEMVKIKD